jgi:hypothetical protein
MSCTVVIILYVSFVYFVLHKLLRSKFLTWPHHCRLHSTSHMIVHNVPIGVLSSAFQDCCCKVFLWVCRRFKWKFMEQIILNVNKRTNLSLISVWHQNNVTKLFLKNITIVTFNFTWNIVFNSKSFLALRFISLIMKFCKTLSSFGELFSNNKSNWSTFIFQGLHLGTENMFCVSRSAAMSAVIMKYEYNHVERCSLGYSHFEVKSGVSGW